MKINKTECEMIRLVKFLMNRLQQIKKWLEYLFAFHQKE